MYPNCIDFYYYIGETRFDALLGILDFDCGVKVGMVCFGMWVYWLGWVYCDCGVGGEISVSEQVALTLVGCHVMVILPGKLV